MTRNVVRFIRRDQVVELGDVGPGETLLDYLRLREGALGTKEGCAEGDCGACTVALGTWCGGRVRYEPVNSCIQLLGMIDGKELVTVDDLASPRAGLHPVQRALVDHHGSQCGFCTPGFVMSLFTLYHSGSRAERADVNDWLAGNLCRCTGYRPIVDAALSCCNGVADDAYARREQATVTMLESLHTGEDLFVGDEERFFAAPASSPALAGLYQRFPDATLVAGATDVGLWITKQLRDLPRIIHVGRVKELLRTARTTAALEIGAAVSYAQAEAALQSIDPDVGEMLRRLGAKQVRAAGTIGGNIANGSPIADTPPVLIALDSRLELRCGEALREIPLENFFVDYGRQDHRAGEFVSKISIPHLEAGQFFRCYKISKRFDQDISAVLGAFRLTIAHDEVVGARIAYGGMAATPKRAAHTEAAVIGLSLRHPAHWVHAIEALGRDFQPIRDMRASARYRLRVAGGLLEKALREVSGVPTHETRVVGVRDEAA